MWDERYSEEGFAYGTAPNDYLISVADRIPTGGRVLCLAEGEGRNAVFLAERGYRVVAVDQSAVGLQKAQRLAESRGVTLQTVQGNLADYALEKGRYAGIVSIWAHVPPTVRQRLHAQIAGGLQGQGVFILEAYTPDQIGAGTGGPADPALTMTAEGLRRELHGLDLEVCRELWRSIEEGRYHRGRSAVVQVLAVKR